ncbi:Fic family protein [Hymenobacter sp. ISL-91]|uniref:Fic family protein n=1 Tax=Hymenobacter sp. ISL-91 TaxID=2819151 RepID=UPI001BE59729|nr:Fic family protein [Hymenobacter sp. ISL-91]MBT2559257.1 Fic family protein [Hymenobacter sp. ISL-91]
MEKNVQWPLLVFGTSDPALNRRIRQARQREELREVAPRIYSPDLTTPPAVLVRKNWLPIIQHLFPGAIISHRSQLEGQPTGDGHLFLTYKYTRNVELPGLTVHLLEGPGPQPGDAPFGGGDILFASEARGLLENLQPARVRKGGVSKALPIETVEERLEMVLRVRGEAGLNALRDQARDVATALNWPDELAALQRIVGALLTTHSIKVLSSPVARARALGLPFDAGRVALFTTLAGALRTTALPERVDPAPVAPAYYTVAFFEAYFSNFIEGTVFQVDEAHRMVETGQAVGGRHADSHDVLSTYQLCINPAEMRVVPRSAEELLALLQRRHGQLMRARPDKRPGQWKEYANQAGLTNFVEPELVRGTLHEGFALCQGLTDPLARAMFMMFLISEVHPFDDGNGRLARLMMNAELVSAGQCRIIVTTRAREAYLDALRRLSRQSDPSLYIRMLSGAQQFVAALRVGTYEEVKQQLEAQDAFTEVNSQLRW